MITHVQQWFKQLVCKLSTISKSLGKYYWSYPARGLICNRKKEDIWTKSWEAYKTEIIRAVQWIGGNEGSSGKLCIPEIGFLDMAAKSDHALSCINDKDEMHFSMEVMIRTAMSLTMNSAGSISDITGASMYYEKIPESFWRYVCWIEILQVVWCVINL